MAKITFPAVVEEKYSHAISQLRTEMLRVAEHIRRNPGAIADTRKQIDAMLKKYADAAIVIDGQTATASGAGTTATFTVTDGVITVALT